MRISDWSSDVCSSDLTHTITATTRNLANALASSTTPRSENNRFRPLIGLKRSGLGVSASALKIQPPTARLPAIARSEEHTSELQSLMRISYAVFCLKKKTTLNKNRHTLIQYTSDN